MNRSGLSDETVKTLIDRALGEHDAESWQLLVSMHTDHTGETFPCINDFGPTLYNYNVEVETKANNWCVTHNREMTGPCCDPTLEGITMPCRPQ